VVFAKSCLKTSQKYLAGRNTGLSLRPALQKEGVL
jgi:hypothetical protein